MSGMPPRMQACQPTNGNPWFGDQQPLRAILALMFAAMVALACACIGEVVTWMAAERLQLNAGAAFTTWPLHGWRLESGFKWAAVLMFAYHMLPFMVPPVLPPRPDAGRNFVNDPKFLRRIGVVVPAHKAGREIGDVLDRMLRYFEPEHIVVVDNANEPMPPDDTRDVLTRVSRGNGQRSECW